VNVPFFVLDRQTAELQPLLADAVNRVLESGRLVLGDHVSAFETSFASWLGASHAVGVASGTDAVTIALMATGVRSGDEVITAANTCVPTIAGIEASGATVVLVDADPLTYTLDPTRLGEALTGRTRAVVPVHLYGQCADMEAITAFAGAHELVVVEDAAQAHGAEMGGRRAGTFGDAAAFSFYPTKNLGAYGDAGAVVTSSQEIAERARALRAYGEQERYESVIRGMNSRLDEMQAALLEVKLPHLDRWNARRDEIARYYSTELRCTGLDLPPAPIGGTHAWHLYVVRHRGRDQFRNRLERRGVDTLVHYPRPVHEHPAYVALRRAGSLATSERFAREVVSLPLFPELTDAEVEFVVEEVRSAADGRL